MFDDDEPEVAAQAAEPPRRSRALLITVGAPGRAVPGVHRVLGVLDRAAVVLLASATGRSSRTLVRTKIGLFAVFGLRDGASSVAANILLAYRFRPIFRPASPEQVSLDRYREAVDPDPDAGCWSASPWCSASSPAAPASGKWREFLLWRNGVDFGTTDPYFKRDIGFYVFDLPWLHYLVDFAMAVAVVSPDRRRGRALPVRRDPAAVAAATGSPARPPPSCRCCSGIFVLVKAADYWLDRFDLLNDSGSLITGVTYTDDNAVLPAQEHPDVHRASSARCCSSPTSCRRTWLLPSVGLGLLVLSAILLGVIWPGIVQQFQVEPSEADKEAPYIAKNIEATRAAYDIEDAEVDAVRRHLHADPRAAGRASVELPGIRLVDPALVQPTFEQRQQVTRLLLRRRRCSTSTATRSTGIDRDVVLAVRELDQDGLPEDSKNWANQHTVYTHGYGVIAAYGNQRDRRQPAADRRRRAGLGRDATSRREGELTDLTADGYERPDLLRREEPGVLRRRQGDRGRRRTSSSTSPTARRTAAATTTTYDGAAGVEVGGLFNKLLYAWKFGEPNLVLSEPGQRELQDPLRPQPAGDGREGRAVADRRPGPVPGGRGRPGGVDPRRLHHDRPVPARRSAGPSRR